MPRPCLLAMALVLAACSKKEPAPAATPLSKSQPVVALAENIKHPLAKHIELAGFRMTEKAGGKLTVRFVVINHSRADISDLGLDVTTPACTVSVKVPTLAPEEAKDSSGECTTTLRVYELPDWQFIKPTFKITSPNES